MATAAANAATVVCGSEGVVGVNGTRVCRITEWSFNPTFTNITEFGDSDSQGYTNRACGRKDGSGSFSGRLDTGQHPTSLFLPGDVVNLTLWETASTYWNIPRALITSFEVTFDNDAKEPVSWTAEFVPDGIYYAPGQAGQPTEPFPT